MSSVLPLGLAVFLAWRPCAPAAQEAPPGAAGEIQALVRRVQAKLAEAKTTKAELKQELKDFEMLMAKYPEGSDGRAQTFLMQALLYAQVFEETGKAFELIQQLKRECPMTAAGKGADVIVDYLKDQEQAREIQRGLEPGTIFPWFAASDLEGKALSSSDYNDKVVLIMFWASWYPPCLGELPTVLQAYEKHHGQGFEVLGVSLDQDEQRLRGVIRERNLSWRQCFDGPGWNSKLAARYGVQSLPANFLLDREGKVLARNVRAPQLEQTVAQALSSSPKGVPGTR